MNRKITYKFVGTLILASTIGLSLPSYADNTSKVEQKSLMQNIIEKYMAASNTDKTLKYLLDAKMDLSTAEHDLLLTHDKIQAKNNIENAISYLTKAKSSANSKIKNSIEALLKNLKSLEKKTLSTDSSAPNNNIDQLLGMAQSTLSKALEHTSSSSLTKQKITDINKEIQALRKQIEHINLKDDYESAMNTLNTIINNM